MQIIIKEPVNLYKSLRNEIFTNPFKWFRKFGFRYFIILFCLGIIVVITKHPHNFSYLKYFFELLITCILANLIFYPLEFLNYRIHNEVRITAKDIWIKRNYMVIKYEKIKKVIFEKFKLSDITYKKVNIGLTTNKWVYFFVEDKYEIDNIIEIFKKNMIEIQE